ncbi:MAG: flavin-containing monooxygenase [Ardenticatenaceae bacterium]
MIIVIGAGPSGLATAYYLEQRGLSYLVLEKERVGFAWQNHYDTLHLHTLKEVSGLPGLPMAADYPRFPSAAQQHAYLNGYAEHFKLNIECGVEVLNANYADGMWHLQTNKGPYQSDRLLLATGIWSTPFSARFEGQASFGGQIIHAREYKNAIPFVGQRVLVVGAGNSGCEIAAELSEQGADASIAIRSGTTFAPYPTATTLVRTAAWFFRTFPRRMSEPVLSAMRRDFRHIGIRYPAGSLLDAYPVVGYELPDAIEAGNVTLYSGIKRLSPGCVHFSDGQHVPFDAIILATGYRPTVNFVRHELQFDAKGYPRFESGRATHNPHLYSVGFTYPATEGFLQAVGRDARAVVYSLYGALQSS